MIIYINIDMREYHMHVQYRVIYTSENTNINNHLSELLFVMTNILNKAHVKYLILIFIFYI